MVEWAGAGLGAAGTAEPFTDRCAVSSASRVIEDASSCETGDGGIEDDEGA